MKILRSKLLKCLSSYTLVLWIMASLAVQAHESGFSISGQVNSQGKGVPFVAVYVEGTGYGTITDNDGYFHLTGLSGTVTQLNVKGMGYQTKRVELDAHALKTDLFIEIDPDVRLLQQVVVSGSRVGVLRFLPGSVGLISPQDLITVNPVSGNEILRSIPGVHVVEEEGAGLRTNIGIRGLDPDKSRNVLILEDGIPVALAPYGEPEMYFTPNIDRMHAIEILKGNGSILFGPQTIGGVINYITADPPAAPSGKISVTGGDLGYFNTRVNYGNTQNRTGYLVDFTRKQAENFGPTEFLLHDFNGKILTELSPVSQLGVKLSIYDEVSNSTYVGLTQPMFDAGGFDDLRIAPDDVLKVRRYGASINHRYMVSSDFRINTTAFAYTTTRNWNRQDFSYSATASNLTGISHGFADVKDGAIYMRNSTGQRNRQFEVAGIEPRIHYSYAVAGSEAVLDAGARFLYERAFEQRVDGTSAGKLSGNLREDEIRTGQAISSYLQNKILVGEKLSFTTGLRAERFQYEREIMRLNFTDTLLGASSSVFEIIPGAGINYNFSEKTGVFAGIHRGFAPPRTKDAITSGGEALLLDAEKSWSSELGLRADLNMAQFEFTLFHMDFSNQVIPVSESSGGAGSGLINGDETRHSGLEAAVLIPLEKALPAQWDAFLGLNATWVRSEFSGDRFVVWRTRTDGSNEREYINIKGNKTPYAPAFSLSGSLYAQSPWGLGLRLSGNYVGEQYTDVLNTDQVQYWIDLEASDNQYRYTQATANGRIGKLDPYFVINLSAWYKHQPTGLGVNFAVKNITDERYISTRRPQGIRVGLPRFISAGISLDF